MLTSAPTETPLSKRAEMYSSTAGAATVDMRPSVWAPAPAPTPEDPAPYRASYFHTLRRLNSSWLSGGALSTARPTSTSPRPEGSRLEEAMVRRESMPLASTKLLVPLALIEKSVSLPSRRDLEKDEARRTSRGMSSSHTCSTSSRRRSASVRSDSQRTESIAAAVAASSSHVEAGSSPPAPSAFSSSSSPVASVHAARLRSSRSSSWTLAVAASRSAPQSTRTSV